MRKAVNLITGILFTAAFVFSITACGGTSTGTSNTTTPTSVLVTETTPTQPPAAPPAKAGTGDLSGTWNGQWGNWTPDNAVGTFVLQWSQQGSALSGTVTIAGTPCLSGGTMTGQLNGDQISFGVVQGQVSVDYTGVVNNDGTMAGTYSTTCGNAQGTWQAKKQ